MTSELTVIKNHSQGKKHKQNIRDTKNTIKESFLSNESTLLDDNVKSAEIKLCAFLVEHNIAFNATEHLDSLLKSIFPDSQICQNIKLKRTKATAVVTNVISPFTKNSLVDTLKNTKFSVMIDESTDISCSSTMCIIVRFYCPSQNEIVSRFWDLVQLHDKTNSEDKGATAQNLFDTCIKTFTQHTIPLRNIIGFGSDSCNTMFGAHNSVSQKIKLNFPGVYLMKCICHSLHLACSEACKNLPTRCEDLVRQIYNFFSHSSKRQSQLYQFQSFLDLQDHKILHPSATRWLSLTSVVNRIIEQWDALRLFFNDKWLSEKLASTRIICEQLNDPFTKAFYLFMEWVLPKFTLLNKYFQSEKVILDKLHERIMAAYKDLLLCFMQSSYIMHTPPEEINITDRKYYLQSKDIYLGKKYKITHYT